MNIVRIMQTLCELCRDQEENYNND